MFFRRETPQIPSFSERLAGLGAKGITVTPLAGGQAKLVRGEVGAVLTSEAGGEHAGVTMGDEIGVLVDAGNQKLFRTPSGKVRAATAALLRAIHEFEEDVKEAMGQTSLYNEGLGTVSTLYLYDRLKDRDAGVPKRVWER